MRRVHVMCESTHAHDGAARVFFHGCGDHANVPSDPPFACMTVGVNDGLLRVWGDDDEETSAAPQCLRDQHKRLGRLRVRAESRTTAKDAHAFVRLSICERFVFSASPAGVILARRTTDGKQVARFRCLATPASTEEAGVVSAIALSYTGEYLFAAVGPAIHVIRFDDEALTLSDTGHVFRHPDKTDAPCVTHLDASPHKPSPVVTAAYSDGTIHLWRADPTVLQTSPSIPTTIVSEPISVQPATTPKESPAPALSPPNHRHRHHYRCTQQAPDASIVACGTATGAIEVFCCEWLLQPFWIVDLADLVVVRSGNASPSPIIPAGEEIPAVTGTCFNPKRYEMAAVAGRHIVLFDMEPRAPLLCHACAPGTQLTSVAFSKDGDRLFAASTCGELFSFVFFDE